MKKRLITSVLLVVFVCSSPLSAVDGDKAAYNGGIFTPYAGAEDPVAGRLDTKAEEALVLSSEKKEFREHELRIPYSKIVETRSEKKLEYQDDEARKASRGN